MQEWLSWKNQYKLNCTYIWFVLSFFTSYRKEILKLGTFVLWISIPSEPLNKYLSPSQCDWKDGKKTLCNKQKIHSYIRQELREDNVKSLELIYTERRPKLTPTKFTVHITLRFLGELTPKTQFKLSPHAYKF